MSGVGRVRPIREQLAVCVLVLLCCAWRGCGAALAGPPTFESLTALDGVRIVNEPMSDVVNQGQTPSPLTWETDPPAGNYDWSFFSIATDFVPTPRNPSGGATLVSPHWAVVAAHVTGTKGYWLQPDGTEISRTWASTVNIGGDLTLVRFATPITTITPVSVLADCSIAAGKPCVAVEHDRHLNVLTVHPTLTNVNGSASVTRPAAGGDGLESGDSGKPALVRINGRWLLIVTGFTSAVSGNESLGGSGPNASAYIAEINAQLAADGERLDVLAWGRNDGLRTCSGGRVTGAGGVQITIGD